MKPLNPISSGKYGSDPGLKRVTQGNEPPIAERLSRFCIASYALQVSAKLAQNVRPLVAGDAQRVPDTIWDVKIIVTPTPNGARVYAQPLAKWVNPMLAKHGGTNTRQQRAVAFHGSPQFWRFIAPMRGRG